MRGMQNQKFTERFDEDKLHHIIANHETRDVEDEKDWASLTLLKRFLARTSGSADVSRSRFSGDEGVFLPPVSVVLSLALRKKLRMSMRFQPFPFPRCRRHPAPSALN